MNLSKKHQDISEKVQALIGEAISLMEELIQEREDYAGERSERWEESDKGQEYLEDTSTLQSAKDGLDGALAELED